MNAADRVPPSHIVALFPLSGKLLPPAITWPPFFEENQYCQKHFCQGKLRKKLTSAVNNIKEFLQRPFNFRELIILPTASSNAETLATKMIIREISKVCIYMKVANLKVFSLLYWLYWDTRPSIYLVLVRDYEHLGRVSKETVDFSSYMLRHGVQ